MLVFTFLGLPGAVLWFSLAAYNQLGDHTSDPIESGGRRAAQPTPQWSPDGSLIVLTRYGSLHTVTADGSQLQPIREWIGDRRSSRAQSPSISPDGSRMAFNLANLKQLWLKDNQLMGEIPPELGSLSKLTYLVLHTNQLSGEIPSELAELTDLTYLALSNNQLSGDIPAWLGLLTNLETLSLANNQLTGEIPPELGSLSKLTYLVLHNNQLSGEIPAWLGLLTNLETLGLAGNQLTGCIPSTLQEVETNDLGDLALPYCAPVFDSASYSFLASEDADVGDVVGTVSATDSDGDIPTYSITGGDDDGKFAMVASTGAITVAGTLDRSDASSYSLTVGASDGYGATGTTTVGITVVESCSRGTVVPNPDDRPELVKDCELLLHIRDTLAGTATLNWSVDTPITDWDGITVGGTPSRVLRLSLISRGLTGTIPPTLAELTGLEFLALNRNELTGPIPAELARLSNLSFLTLAINQLSGEIPAGLGNLANLKQLWLKDNQLTGEIPPELGSLSKLTYLVLHTNQLSGEIPSELAELTDLTYLALSNNQLTGCIPSALQDVARNDLGQLGLSFCGASSD